MGSTVVARRAGTQEASAATAPNSSETAANVVRSSGASRRYRQRLTTRVNFAFGLKPAIAMRSSRDRLRLMFSMIC